MSWFAVAAIPLLLVFSPSGKLTLTFKYSYIVSRSENNACVLDQAIFKDNGIIDEGRSHLTASA